MEKILAICFLTMVVLMQSVFSGPTKGSGACPIKETVKICFPRCLSDFECVGDKRCCKNGCGTSSCADVSPVSVGNEPYNSKPGIITCSNEKCLPGQKCKADNVLKRPKCSW